MSNFVDAHSRRLGRTLERGGHSVIPKGEIKATHDAVAKYKHRLELPNPHRRKPKAAK